MGGCFSKPNRPRLPSPLQQRRATLCLLLPRVGTKTILKCDAYKKDFKEEQTQAIGNFQEGQMTAIVNTELLCVGGIADGSACYLLHLSTFQCSGLSAPPAPLAYGRIQTVRGSALVFGALSVSTDPQHWTPSAPLELRLKADQWKELPQPPAPISLCGSAAVEDLIYLFGGFVGDPEQAVLNTKVVTYHVGRRTWAELEVSCPVKTPLPLCTPLASGREVLIIGGYDPFDHYSEAKDVFLFRDGVFETKESLPLIGELHFNESPAQDSTALHLLSDDETLFSYTFATDSWTYLDISASAATYETERMSLMSPRDAGPSVYWFQRSECQFGEFAISTEKFRTLKLLSFRPFVKHPGLLLNSFGSVIVAGGTKRLSPTREEDTDQVWLLDPSSRHTLDLPPLPCAQSCLRLLQIGGDLYAMCGVTMDAEGFVSRSQVLKDAVEKWEMLPDMMYVARFPGVVYYKGGIYCIAGEAHTDTGMQFNLIQVYRLSTSCWEILRSEYPVGVRHVGVAATEDGIVCFGGLFSSGKVSTACYHFDGAQFRDRSKMQTTTGRKCTYFQDAVQYVNGTIYAFAKSGVLHQYSVASDQWQLVPLAA